MFQEREGPSNSTQPPPPPAPRPRPPPPQRQNNNNVNNNGNSNNNTVDSQENNSPEAPGQEDFSPEESPAVFRGDSSDDFIQGGEEFHSIWDRKRRQAGNNYPQQYQPQQPQQPQQQPAVQADPQSQDPPAEEADDGDYFFVENPWDQPQTTQAPPPPQQQQDPPAEPEEEDDGTP